MKKIILCSVMSVIIALGGCESKESKQAKIDKITTDKAFEFVKKVASSDLIDPSSAQFRNLKGYCGELNSKNKFGGYVGFNRFIVLNDKAVVFEDEQNISTQVFPNAWSKICSEKPKIDANGELVLPNFKLPDPIYNKPDPKFGDTFATTTPTDPVLKEGMYIYPILQIHCTDGRTKFSLYSMKSVSYSLDKHVAISTKEGGADMVLIPYLDDDDGYQTFGSNEQLYSVLKRSDNLTISFRASGDDFSMQTFDLKSLKNGMRKQKNNCNWNQL